MSNIKLFESKQIRSVWNEEEQKWYFSIIDIIEILTGTDRPRKYWIDLKAKLKKEGSELSEKIGQLKMESSDSKFYKTDIADTEQLLRFIQSIPSPKAEPFKLWLAQVGGDRLGEIENPEAATELTREFSEKKELNFRNLFELIYNTFWLKPLVFVFNCHAFKGMAIRAYRWWL